MLLRFIGDLCQDDPAGPFDFGLEEVAIVANASTLHAAEHDKLF